MAKKLKLSQSTVSRIWRAFGLKPQRSETFVLSKDPQLVRKVRDIVIHLVLDNDATQKTGLIKSWLAKRPRCHLHFTPTHASWINQVERWFALLSARKIKRGSHSSVGALIHAIQDFIATHNHESKPFNWQKTSGEILDAISRFASKTLQAFS